VHAEEPWKELDEQDIQSGAKRFKEILSQTHLSQELADEVMDQVNELNNESHNLIFVFSDNEWAITGIHVPDEALNGEESPVLMRGANPKHIIAAFGQTEIRKRIKIFDELEIVAGLNEGTENKWVEELESMAKSVMVKLRENPPESWDDLLKDPND